MGLSVEVGVLADLLKNDPEGASVLRNDLSLINQVLIENNISEHLEPEELKSERISYWHSLPHFFLHCLRRIYAYSVADEDWIPTPASDDYIPEEDMLVEDETMMFDSHLLCHSDYEGFYLPLRFDEIVIDERDRIRGAFLCSSYCLLEELVYVASKIGITLNEGFLSDGEAIRIINEVNSENGFFKEYAIWYELYQAAKSSVESKSAIVFG